MVVQVPFQISECTFYLVVCIWHPATAIFLISEQIWQIEVYAVHC